MKKTNSTQNLNANPSEETLSKLKSEISKEFKLISEYNKLTGKKVKHEPYSSNSPRSEKNCIELTKHLKFINSNWRHLIRVKTRMKELNIIH